MIYYYISYYKFQSNYDFLPIKRKIKLGVWLAAGGIGFIVIHPKLSSRNYFTFPRRC